MDNQHGEFAQMAGDEELLSHYTDVAGLEGITQTSEIWCTSVRHLNDRSEFHYVHELVQGLLFEALNEENETATRFARFVERVEQQRPAIWSEMNAVGAYYIASFTEADDDLSQWRGYGGHVAAELRFSRQMLESLAGDNGFQLICCEYSSDKLMEALRAVVAKVRAKFEALDDRSWQPDGIPPPDMWRIKSEFWNEILKLAPRYKHWKFSAEREWRLVSPMMSMSLPDERVRFRMRNGRLLPYMAFSLKSNPFALREVRVGPGGSMELDFATTVFLLRSRNLEHCGVSASSIPYRVP